MAFEIIFAALPSIGVLIATLSLYLIDRLRRGQIWGELTRGTVLRYCVVGVSGWAIATAISVELSAELREKNSNAVSEFTIRSESGAVAAIGVAIGLGALIAAISEVMSAGSGRRLREIELQLDSQAEPSHDFGSAVKETLYRARLREEKLLARAESRDARMLAIGTSFLLLSFVSPIASGLLYAYTDPLPQHVVQRVLSIKNDAVGDNVSLDISARRDWQVLIGGVSIGFLFLAAAAAVLRQKGKEVVIAERAAAKVSYYSRLEGLLTLESLAATPNESSLVAYLQKMLMGI